MFGKKLVQQMMGAGGDPSQQGGQPQPTSPQDPVAEINQKLDQILMLLQQDAQSDSQEQQPDPNQPVSPAQ